jgi:hypothetical protein
MLGKLAKTALVRLDFPTAFTLGLQLSLELLDMRSRGFQRGGLRVVELFGLTIGHGVISVGSDKTRGLEILSAALPCQNRLNTLKRSALG